MTRKEVEEELGYNLETIASIGPRGLWPKELASLYTTAREITPEVVVEIGACHGVASVVLGLVVKKSQGKLYSFDIILQPKWYTNMQTFGVATFAQLIKVKSPDVTVATLPFQVIDYLLIDGDHSYEGVLADYKFWSKLVRVGGRIAFHDYYSTRGVRQAVTEISTISNSGLQQVDIVPGKMYNDPESVDPESGLIVLEKCTLLSEE